MSNLTAEEQAILDDFNDGVGRTAKESQAQAWLTVWDKLRSLPEYAEVGDAPGVICALRIIDRLVEKAP